MDLPVLELDDNSIGIIMSMSGGVGRCACVCRRWKKVRHIAWRMLAEAMYPAESLNVEYYPNWMHLVRDDNARSGLRVKQSDVRCNWLLNSSILCYQARVVSVALKRDSLTLLVDARGESDLRRAYTSRVRVAVQQPTNAMNVEEILNTRGFDPSSFAKIEICASYRTPGREVCALHYVCKSHLTYATRTTYYFNYNGAHDYADVPLFHIPPNTSLREFFFSNGKFVKDPEWNQVVDVTPATLIQAAGPDDEPWFRFGPLRDVHVRQRFHSGSWGGGRVDLTNPEMHSTDNIEIATF